MRFEGKRKSGGTLETWMDFVNEEKYGEGANK